MALQKQKIAMPFLNGIDTKSDDKQSQLGTLLSAENTIFEKPGKLLKRTGFEQITPYNISGEKIENIRSITSYFDELNIVTNSNFYTYSENINKWINKGTLIDVRAESKSIIRNEKEQSKPDCLFVENTKIFIYSDSAGLKYSVIDNLALENSRNIVNVRHYLIIVFPLYLVILIYFDILLVF